MGMATPTNPGSAQTPDYKCFYLATTPDTYTNLGGLIVADGEVAILKYDTSWHKEVTGAATAEQLNQLGQKIGVFSSENMLTLSVFSPLQNGEVSGKGSITVTANSSKRVVTTNIQHNAEVVHLSVMDGFRIYLSKYSSDTDSSYTGDSSWMTGYVEIPANTYFRVIVARVEEISEKADIALFASKVLYCPDWYDALKKDRAYAFYSCVTPRKIRYIQHKGLVSEAPENSLPAFILAGERNAYSVECDVRMTSDGVLVLMHDATIDRTTDGSGNVNSFTYAQLQNYHIDTGTNVEKYTQEELVIPSLEQYLQICAKYGMVAVIELKVAGENVVEKTIELLYKYNMQNSCIILTFHDSNVTAFRRIDDNIHIQWEVGSNAASQLESIIEYYAKYPNFSIGIDYNDYTDKDWLASMVRKAMELHLLVNVFTATTTINEGQIAELFPDFITTDLAH